MESPDLLSRVKHLERVCFTKDGKMLWKKKHNGTYTVKNMKKKTKKYKSIKNYNQKPKKYFVCNRKK